MSMWANLSKADDFSAELQFLSNEQLIHESRDNLYNKLLDKHKQFLLSEVKNEREKIASKVKELLMTNIVI
jgi:hypothetical protein